MTYLSPLQSSAVTEIINISIGRAASSLNQLVEEEISLTVPSIHFLRRAEAGYKIDALCANGACAVRQEFSGPCAGDALLVFPEEKSFELARAIISEAALQDKMTEMNRDILTEVGNIILNASLGCLANILKSEIVCDLPEYLTGDGQTILGLKEGANANCDLSMFIEVDFVLKKRNINGYVIIVLDMDSAKKFMELVDAYIYKATA